MRRGAERKRSRYLAAAVCIAAGVALGAWHNRRAALGQNDPVTGAVRTVVAPIAGAAGGVIGWFGRQLGWLARGRTVDVENAQLRAENERLKEEIARLREADATAQRLRAEAGLPPQPGRKRIAADVIAVRPAPGVESIVVNRGSRDGVSLRSVVVTRAGLVGRVYDVALTTSAVLLLTDSKAAAGALIQRPESRAVGVCRGDGSLLLSLLYLNLDADVKPGDAVVSSGLGGGTGIYPRGIPIGTVVSVANDAPGSTRNVRVRPSADLERLEEVFILL